MKNPTSETAPTTAETAKALLDQQIAHRGRPSQHSTDLISLGREPKAYRRRKKGGMLKDGLVDVVLSAEGKISKHEKLVLTMLRSARPIEHWTRERNDGERMRVSKARGSILALYRMTGESPPDIMVRLGLTEEEIARIHPFTCKEIWT